mmetsp:Transcript_31900/g.74635  ORF Transcript_31900/g.74635 Transcript_31900/m.74635 type:complete len:220 (+) Transcript_31900:421-1080(+)
MPSQRLVSHATIAEHHHDIYKGHLQPPNGQEHHSLHRRTAPTCCPAEAAAASSSCHLSRLWQPPPSSAPANWRRCIHRSEAAGRGHACGSRIVCQCKCRASPSHRTRNLRGPSESCLGQEGLCSIKWKQRCAQASRQRSDRPRRHPCRENRLHHCEQEQCQQDPLHAQKTSELAWTPVPSASRARRQIRHAQGPEVHPRVPSPALMEALVACGLGKHLQ